MKRKVTTEFTTASPLGDIFAALSTLNIDNLNVKVNTVAEKGNGARRRGYKKGNGRGRPPHYKDSRIVWNEENGNIDVNASLAKMNMSRDILLDTATRVGTAEYVVKKGMLRQEQFPPNQQL